MVRHMVHTTTRTHTFHSTSICPTFRSQSIKCWWGKLVETVAVGSSRRISIDSDILPTLQILTGCFLFLRVCASLFYQMYEFLIKPLFLNRIDTVLDIKLITNSLPPFCADPTADRPLPAKKTFGRARSCFRN